MKKLLLIIFMASGLFAQDQLHTWFYSSGLPVLEANSDSAWAGSYPALTSASDSANAPTAIELFHFKAWFRIRQTGRLFAVQMYIKNAASVTNFRVRLWRRGNTTTEYPPTFDTVGITENLAGSLVTGTNLIVLSTAIDVIEGDYYSVWYEGGADGISLKVNAGLLADSCKSAATLQSGTDLIWSTKTAQLRYFPVRFFMQSPVFSSIGNSIIDGTPLYSSGVSPTSNTFYDRRITSSYRIGNHFGWTWQNMGWAGQAITAGIQARFMTDVTDQNPRIIIGEGGTNDIAGTTKSLAIITSIRKMIDSSLVHDIPIYWHSWIARSAFTNSRCQTADTVELAIKNHCDTTENAYYVDLRPILGLNRDSGTVQPNYWDCKPEFFVNDDVHPNCNGYGRIGREFINLFKTKYAFTDTSQTYLIDYTTFGDSIYKSDFPFQISAQAKDDLGIDSLTYSYRINSGSIVSEKFTFNSLRTTADIGAMDTGYNYAYSLDIDTSTLSIDDIIEYKVDVYGYNTTSSGWLNTKIGRNPFGHDALVIFQRGYYSDSVRVSINMFIEYVLDTVWSGQYTSIDSVFDEFWLLGSENDTTALKGWVNGTVATNNSTTFTALLGFQGNGSTQYIDLNFPFTGATLYGLDSGSFGLYCRTNADGGTDFGIYPASSKSIIATRLSSQFYHDNNAGDVGIGMFHSDGLYISNRMYADTLQGWVDDTLKKQAVNVAVGIPTGDPFLCARNNGSGTPTSFTAKQYFFVFIGRKFRTNAQVPLFFFGVERFADQLGAGVVP